LASIIFNAILKTKDDWVNKTDGSLYFELPINFIRVNDYEVPIQPIPKITLIHYQDGRLVDPIRMKPVEVKEFPAKS
jgi:hypothetical protein